MSSVLDITPLAALSDGLARIVAEAAPAVVSVLSHRARSSGLVWRPGLVVTADEALAEEGTVEVVLAGGERVSATILGRDPTTDIALLRVERPGLAPLEPARGPAALGSLAVAVGARDGMGLAALGVVAATGPAWQSMRGGDIDARIELDLSLRREAEGGPVLDAHGCALGMTVFGPRRRVLVIPASTIERVAAQLEAKGRIARGYLGLALRPVRIDRHGGLGAMVMAVEAGGPGAAAGVCQGDIVTGWDGEPLRGAHALSRRLGPDSVGRTCTLALRRAGEAVEVALVVGERPQA